MELTRRTFFVYALLLAVWLLVVGWQVEEHARFKSYAKSSLRNRSKAIANTLGASIRGLQFRGGAIFGRRLQPVLDEMVSGQTNDLGVAGEVTSIVLLNPAGEQVASAGRAFEFDKDLLQEGERWGQHNVTFAYPIEGARVSEEGATNAPAPLLLLTNSLRDGVRGFPRREGRA